MKNSTFGVSRIEAFSDGVLAIIVTLLVLEIKSPKLLVATSSAEAWHSLVVLAPKFASFLLSFIFVAVFWINHHRFFLLVRQSDWGLLWSNNLLLLLLCTIPFPTAFMGDYPNNSVTVALFASIMSLAGVAFNVMWRHARNQRLIDGGVSEEFVNRAINRGLIGPVAYGFAAILAPFALALSWAIFLLVPLYYSWPTKTRDRSEGPRPNS